MMIIGFTGHRLISISSQPRIIHLTKRIIEYLKPDYCITGMALGYDQIVAKCCIELKQPFIAAVPFQGQEKLWPQEIQKQYLELIKESFGTIIVSEGGYTPTKMHIRNQWICNHSNVMVGCYNGSLRGGTYNCLNYASKINLPIIRLKP